MIGRDARSGSPMSAIHLMHTSDYMHESSGSAKTEPEPRLIIRKWAFSFFLLAVTLLRRAPAASRSRMPTRANCALAP